MGDGGTEPTPSRNEVADALNNLTQTVKEASRPAPAPWLLPVTILSVVGAVGGFLLAVLARDRGIRWVGAAIGTLSVLGGGSLTIFKISDVKLPGIRVEFPTSSATPALEFVNKVGPFKSGKADALEEKEAAGSRGTMEDAVKALTERAKGRELSYLLFVGSADKFELSPRLLAKYGSNVGLARARGEWVKEQVLPTLKGRTFESLALTVGPNRHGIGLSPEETRADRGVAIYAAWRERRKTDVFREWLRTEDQASAASVPRVGADVSSSDGGGL